jgi:DNA-binding CsgD family transcriptional regulator
VGHGAVDLIEACYRLQPLDRWATQLCSLAGRSRFGGAIGCVAVTCELTDDGLAVDGAYHDGTFGDDRINVASANAGLGALRAAGPGLLRWLNGAGPAAHNARAMTASEQPIALAPTPAGAVDTLCFVAQRGRARLLFCLAMPRAVSTSALASRTVRSMSEHLAIGYRFAAAGEHGPDATVARFDPGGRCLHNAGSLARGDVARLADAVRAMDRARCRRTRLGEHEAAELWRGVVDGRHTLVESFERGGRRVVVAVPVAALPAQRLTAMERRVAELAAQGLANKAIGAQLNIAASTAAVHLAAALRKLRCDDRNQLMRSRLFGA